MDGNVMRVGARVLAMDEDPRSAGGRKRLEGWIHPLMDGQCAATINEALMELGATLCTPSDPDCGQCPIAGDCLALARGEQERYPPPRQRRTTDYLRWVAACIVAGDGSWLVRRIDEGPILRGLWLPPLGTVVDTSDPRSEAKKLVPVAVSSNVVVGLPVRHNITHRKIDVVPVRFKARESETPTGAWRWVDPHKPGVPTSSLLRKLVDTLSDDR
jgi:A/G-specific adenine glycosylase